MRTIELEPTLQVILPVHAIPIVLPLCPPTRSFLAVPEITKQVRTLMSFTSWMMRR